ncbi:MAG: glycoside hydrolase family 31 protein [Saprospiraceae bacterium]
MNEFIKEEIMIRTENEKFPLRITSSRQEGNQFYFVCENEVELRVSILTDRMLRFRYAPNGIFENDFSYAIDTKFQPKAPKVEFKEKEDHYRITTQRIICRIEKADLRVIMMDKSGTIISEDEKGFHWEDDDTNGGAIVQMSKKLQSQENFYGLGDKTGKANMRKNRYSIWGTDSYGYGVETDPLYKNVPFYYGIHNDISYGIFFDNSFRSFFDFGHERANVTSFWAGGGEMNYYFFYGPELLEVAEQFVDLTGKPELPPMWALGYHQCKWSYYPESQVKEITAEFRRRRIPCDAIYLDIDYMDGFRCFTWDKEKFPEPKRMIKELEKDGFKTVVMIDPGIKVDKNYWVCKEGLEKDMFCKRGDGPLLVAPVWPGDCFFPDFTNPEVREWWAGLYKEMIADLVVHGVWNDMNEPAIFLADNFTQSDKTFYPDVRHDYDGNPCSHRKAHNVYGMQMSRGTFHGLKQNAPDKRPFVITRSTYAGGQRYSSGWTGDNLATWEHLKIANKQCQRVAISGMSFIGSDIGGFIDQPDGELYLRWLQMAVFHPFFRTHSSGDHGEQEPWTFGEDIAELSRRAIEFRYRILPYIYTAFWQYTTKGTPMLRPLAFLEQQEKETLHRMEEFTLGDHILVCPISQPKVEGRWMFLPKGDWFNFWTDEKAESNLEFWAPTGIDEIPVFVRGGAVIPSFESQQYVGEKEKPQIYLHVYYINGENKSQFYLDEGEGYGYEKGESTLRNYIVTGDENKLTISQKIEGNFEGMCQSFKIMIHGLPQDLASAKIGEESLKFSKEKDKKKEVFEINVDRDFEEIVLEW